MPIETSRWDPWTRRPTGLAMRVMFGGLGTVLGLTLVWASWFGASFKKSEPQWDLETRVALVLGLLVVGSTVLAAFRPTKRNALMGLLVIALVPVAGSLL